ncbi:alpha/beta hydrolase [uncultured Roseibium sp.]|uniref:alpha/beta hydrolase n=1 Tax=uncultured Roseibium sp. TaxID=1936171 RepID=UPI0025939B31|nr:alpha/beta hydrolase [uncultured Roseibium sp.]
MDAEIEISLLGQMSVSVAGTQAVLPSSKKARALLAFLVATGRPHRRERLCELFWDAPDDPKASLRWALSKLRNALKITNNDHIVADRERVFFDPRGVNVDIQNIRSKLQSGHEQLPVSVLEAMVRQLDDGFLDGLDNAGDDAFDAWLVAERTDADTTRADLLMRLLAHPNTPPLAVRKWHRLLRSIDPISAEKFGLSDLDACPVAASECSSDPDGQMILRRSNPPCSAADRLAYSRSNALKNQEIGFCNVTAGTKIAHASLGSGPPILKAANWLTHLEFDWASPIWGQCFADLASDRRFVRYDERGCGLSDWQVADISFDAFVEDLDIVANHLGLERFPLLGISQGCAVSIEYAARHPERVNGLILISGYAVGWRIAAAPDEEAQREAVLTLTRHGWGTENPAYRHIFSSTFMPDASAEDLEWFDEFQRRTTSPENAVRVQEAFGYIDVRHRLPQVKVPTIVLHAKQDQRIPLAQGQALADGIENAEFVPLESRNHILVEGEPALDLCTRKIREFLEKHDI